MEGDMWPQALSRPPALGVRQGPGAPPCRAAGRRPRPFTPRGLAARCGLPLRDESDAGASPGRPSERQRRCELLACAAPRTEPAPGGAAWQTELPMFRGALAVSRPTAREGPAGGARSCWRLLSEELLQPRSCLEDLGSPGLLLAVACVFPFQPVEKRELHGRLLYSLNPFPLFYSRSSCANT